MPSIEVERLTATGRGAVAVVRVRNAGSASCPLDLFFVSAGGTQAGDAEVNRILYGHWRSEDVVVVRTDVSQWEIQCHGGEAAVSRIMRDLGGQTEGSSAIDLNDELLRLLLRCRTRRTADFLLAQSAGIFQKFLWTVCECESADSILPTCQQFLSNVSFANHLTTPWSVTIAGQPNAGKSSLLNALVGFDRSIVFDEPGTTRDQIDVDSFLQGWPFQFRDTAGIRDESGGAIEAQGIELARRAVLNCDACLLVVDSVNGWTREEERLLSLIPETCPVAVLWNKSDVPRSRTLDHAKAETPGDSAVFATSAPTAAGISEVANWLCAELIPHIPEPTEPLPLIDGITAEIRSFCRTSDLKALQRRLAQWL